MGEKGQTKNTEALDRIVKGLSTSFKNSALYPPGHPTLSTGIATLRACLESFFSASDKFELGVTPDNLLVNGAYPKEAGDPVYAEVSSYLHQRGAISVTFSRGITDDELLAFFKTLAADQRALAAAGGIAGSMPKSAHISLKQLDYSDILKAGYGAGDGSPAGDKDVWQSLVAIPDLAAGGELPVTKTEFLNNFLGDPERSATTLNKIYKEALAKVDDNATVGKMRSALIGISRYYDKKGGKEVSAVRKDIADIILRLDPALVSRLFEEGADGGPGAEFSDEVMSNLSDDTVADFIASLIGKEGTVSKHLVAFFDKVTHDKDRAGNMTALVADKLFDMKSLDKGVLSKMQESMKEMLRSDPKNNFLSEMYKMTVETFVDSNVGQAFRSEEFMRLARETGEFLKYDSLVRQEIKLALNILWLEREPESFRKLCEFLGGKFGETVDVLYVEVLREIYDLFMDKLSDVFRTDPGLKAHADRVIELITAQETLTRIVGLVRESGPFELNNIARILARTKPTSVRIVLDAYVAEEDEAYREQMARVISMMGPDIAGELVKRLDRAERLSPTATLGIFEIVKRIDPQETQRMARAMLRHTNARVRREALSAFVPKDPDDAEALLGILKTCPEDDDASAILYALLRSGEQKVLDHLLRFVRKGAPMKRHLLSVVKLCGDFKIRGSFTALKEILTARSFFRPAFNDAVRVAAVVSLAQIGTPESMELVTRAGSDPSGAVRRMSCIIRDLEKNKTGQAEGA